MVSAVHAEDSSSANADSTFSIRKIEWASAGVLRIVPAEGPSFFVRDTYIQDTLPLLHEAGDTCSPEVAESLFFAARVYIAERQAYAYLSRAEHSRKQLEIKLEKKGFSRQESNPALNYLEESGALDDTRFAEAWLHSRLVKAGEGRLKLLAGLASRGISRECAQSAVDLFFKDHDETEILYKTAEKLMKQGKTGDKLLESLARKGFSPGKTRSELKKNGVI